MPFAYREVVISGAAAGIEGTSRIIQQAHDLLVNSMGWTLTDDQTNRAGTSHQLTLQSNGESGTLPTFYLILTSGTGASSAVGQDQMSVKMATAWDTVTHRVPASGVGAPQATASSGTILLNTDSNGTFTAWISGDKDGVVFASRVSTTYDGAYAGRASQFTSTANDPFPLVVYGAGISVDVLANATTNVFGMLTASGGPLATNEMDCLSLFNGTPVGVSEAPDNIFGSTESFVALPIFTTVSDADPVRRSIRGILPNIWVTVGKGGGSTATHVSEDELLAGDGKVYKVFFDSASSVRTTVIRKS